MQTFAGYQRQTFKFNDAWKNEDEHEYIGKFGILAVRFTPADAHGASYGDVGTYRYTIKVPRGAALATVNNVLRNEFSGGCRCEHDCCGHQFFQTGSPKHIKRREWIVDVRAAYNC